MKLEILGECFYSVAMLGLSLSYNQPIENMYEVALKLLKKGGSHVKFLESMVVALDITASRSWWQQEATYRIGITRQSESTEHTLLKRPVVREDFQYPIHPEQMKKINALIMVKNLEQAKNQLPEGFLQRRVVVTNYMTLRRMISQRRNHRGTEWKQFCRYILDEVAYPEFLEVCCEVS